MENQLNLYSEAYKRGIIIQKNFIEPYEDVFIDDEGVIIDNALDVYHIEKDDNNEHRFVGYYFPDGYKSIKIYFNLKIGLSSSLKYFNGLCFNIGFLNKEKNFNELLDFCILASKNIFDKYKITKREIHISDLITLGLETELSEYNFINKKMKKFYFTDNSLSPKERQQISLTRSSQFRRYSKREKIESAIEYLMESDEYIGHSDISKITGLSVTIISRNLTEEDRERIQCKNTQVTGFPTHNEYVKNLNLDLVLNSYLSLKEKGKKTTAVNISEHISKTTKHKLHRVSVSKILKKKEFIELI